MNKKEFEELAKLNTFNNFREGNEYIPEPYIYGCISDDKDYYLYGHDEFCNLIYYEIKGSEDDAYNALAKELGFLEFINPDNLTFKQKENLAIALKRRNSVNSKNMSYNSKKLRLWIDLVTRYQIKLMMRESFDSLYEKENRYFKNLNLKENINLMALLAAFYKNHNEGLFIKNKLYISISEDLRRVIK